MQSLQCPNPVVLYPPVICQSPLSFLTTDHLNVNFSKQQKTTAQEKKKKKGPAPVEL